MQGIYWWKYTCISYTLVRNKLPPKLTALNNKYLLHLTFSESQESKRGLVGWFWHRVSQEVAVQLLARKIIISCLPGVRDSASRLTHMVVGGLSLSPTLLRNFISLLCRPLYRLLTAWHLFSSE